MKKIFNLVFVSHRGFFILFLTGITISFNACKKTGANDAPSDDSGGSTNNLPTLTVTGFDLPAGSLGTKVTITGTNFNSNTVDDTVSFNGIAASIISATSTSIVASVPLAATTGKISVTANGKTAFSATDFRIATVSTVAGGDTKGYIDGNVATALFSNPSGVVSDASGNLYAIDNFRLIRKITPSGVVSTLAGENTLGHQDGLGTAAIFNIIVFMTIDHSGNIYVTEAVGNCVRKITPAGLVTTLATIEGQISLSGIAADNSGNVYVTCTTGIVKVNQEGTVTTLQLPSSFGYGAIATDASGNIYVSKSANNLLSTISKITPSGDITDVVSFNHNIPIADGVGPAANALGATVLALDASGDIYFTEYPGRLRKIITGPTGIITIVTLAGNGTYAFKDGTAQVSEFSSIDGITVDASGVIYVADANDNRIRKIVQ